VLTGPTASGKSELALRLAEAYGAEIIAMDSMTLYRGMDIGTAKPSADERAKVPHHLIDVLDPWESANVAWWLAQAKRCRDDIEGRGKRALFVGGTPLYLKAMLHGLFEAPAPDLALRERLEADARLEGVDALHARLSSVDPAAAKRLHPNDLRRVIRALEVWEQTGRAMSDWQEQWQREALATAPMCWWVNRPRDELYRRIDARAERMLAGGWIDEVRRLDESPRPMSREAAAALGYAEIREHLKGHLRYGELVERVQTLSRQFAKRQLTWFRNLAACQSVEVRDRESPDTGFWQEFT